MRALFAAVALLSLAFLPCPAASAQTGGILIYDPLTAFDGAVYFGASSATSPEQLWRSDGTGAGTRKIQEFHALAYPPPERFTAVGSRLFFFVDGALWRLEDSGMPALVAELPRRERPLEVAATSSALFFTLDDGVHGAELWKSDGTPEGTALFADILPGSDGSLPSLLTPMGETLFFFAYDAGGYGLWRTDGSPSGTSRVRSLPGAAFGDHLIAVNGDRILFAVTDPDAIDAPSQLWRSDGTAEGTIPIRRFATDGPGLCPLSCEPLGLTSLTPFGDFVLFVADDGEHGLELWRSDGTVEGTAIVADLTPGTQGSYFDFSHFVEAGGLVYFASPASGDVLELWATDGTASGTRMVPGVPQGRSAVAGPFPLAAVGNRLLYFYPGALYSTDGTEGGSLRLLDLGPIQGAASLAGFAALPDGSVLFTRNSLSETSLWKTDGTPAGTFLVPLDGRHAVLPSDPSPRAPRTIGSRD